MFKVFSQLEMLGKLSDLVVVHLRLGDETMVCVQASDLSAYNLRWVIRGKLPKGLESLRVETDDDCIAVTVGQAVSVEIDYCINPKNEKARVNLVGDGDTVKIVVQVPEGAAVDVVRATLDVELSSASLDDSFVPDLVDQLLAAHSRHGFGAGLSGHGVDLSRLFGANGAGHANGQEPEKKAKKKAKNKKKKKGRRPAMKS